MAKFVQVAAATVLLMAAGTAACLADSNPLLGHWTLSGKGYVDRDGFDYCAVNPKMDFTATTQTMYVAATKFRPAAQSTTKVQYLVSGNKVYVSSEASFYNAPSYTIVGSNKMMSNDVGHCPYSKK